MGPIHEQPVPWREHCPTCNGNKRIPVFDGKNKIITSRTCPTCNGTGRNPKFNQKRL